MLVITTVKFGMSAIKLGKPLLL